MRSLRIALDHLPPHELSLNARSHWTARLEAMETAKEEIGWLAKIMWKDQPPMERARISYEFHVRDRRERDYDNLLSACKGYPDGLIDIGVIRFDDARHLEIGSVKLIDDTRDATIIIVEEQ